MYQCSQRKIFELLFCFGPYYIACGILVLWLGIEPMSLRVKIQSLNLWMVRDFPKILNFKSWTYLKIYSLKLCWLSVWYVLDLPWWKQSPYKWLIVYRLMWSDDINILCWTDHGTQVINEFPIALLTDYHKQWIKIRQMYDLTVLKVRGLIILKGAKIKVSAGLHRFFGSKEEFLSCLLWFLEAAHTATSLSPLLLSHLLSL